MTLTCLREGEPWGAAVDAQEEAVQRRGEAPTAPAHVPPMQSAFTGHLPGAGRLGSPCLGGAAVLVRKAGTDQGTTQERRASGQGQGQGQRCLKEAALNQALKGEWELPKGSSGWGRRDWTALPRDL